jgi:hypothetical protein
MSFNIKWGNVKKFFETTPNLHYYNLPSKVLTIEFAASSFNKKVYLKNCFFLYSTFSFCNFSSDLTQICHNIQLININFTAFAKQIKSWELGKVMIKQLVSKTKPAWEESESPIRSDTRVLNTKNPSHTKKTIQICICLALDYCGVKTFVIIFLNSKNFSYIFNHN